MGKREERLANSQMISNVAVALIAATVGFLAFAIDKRTLGTLFWLALGIGIALLVLSVILGGRGVAQLDNPGSLFDFQAKACLAGFILLALSIFRLGPAKPDEAASRLDSVQRQLGQVDARLQRLESEVQGTQRRLDEGSAELKAIRTELSGVRKQMPARRK